MTGIPTRGDGILPRTKSNFVPLVGRSQDLVVGAAMLFFSVLLAFLPDAAF